MASDSRELHGQDWDAVTQILIQEHFVALIHQPLVHLTGTLTVLTGMAHENPGHNSSRRPSVAQAQPAAYGDEDNQKPVDTSRAPEIG